MADKIQSQYLSSKKDASRYSKEQTFVIFED